MFKIISRILLLAALLLLVVTSQASAIQGISDTLSLSPFWKFKTIESEHFRVTFPAELVDSAQRATRYLEEAHSILSPVLYWQASYKVNVLVLDNQDSENGLTSAALRFGMALFVTPPDNWMSINYYDNWLRELCLHEYTHFLNLDATHGAYVPLRWFFGDLLLPNQLWPSWMLEGLAVYEETRYTHAGRGRSPWYDSVLRTSVLEEKLNTRQFVTLDKINGPNPWYPGGETAYLFGYELMNQAAQARSAGPAEDHQDLLLSGEDTLGVMSRRSGARVPYLINGNLKNITGETWYTLWNRFVSETIQHSQEQLRTIRKFPITHFEKLTSHGNEIRGPEISPDGRWIVFTQQSLDDIGGLLILNRSTHKTTRLLDKDGGASLSFSPDSRFLFESRLHRIGNYYQISDLEVLNLDDGSTQWLTWNERARDPSVSSHSKQITFTRTKDATTDLCLSDLQFDGWKYSITNTRVIFRGQRYDRVSTPRFSPNGRQIAFTFHHNGTIGEDLLVYDLEAEKASTWVSDGHFNRYPSWDTEGRLYYVSDLTGVDNLYRARFGQVSNFETAVGFPRFSEHLPPGHYVATVLSTQGWDLAEAELSPFPYDSVQLKIASPRGSQADQSSEDHSDKKEFSVQEYSLWPTILPRTWSPLLQVSTTGVYAGGEVTGFDQVDRHRYLVIGVYDSFVRAGDLFAIYDNRILGPTIEAQASLYTSSEVSASNTLRAYGRTQNYSLAAYYTFVNTYSSLTPRISYNFQREIDYLRPSVPGPDQEIHRSRLVPNSDVALTYSDIESSPLAVTTERGRTLTLGARAYLNSGDPSWKGLVVDQENFALGTSHIVLAPTLAGSWVSHLSEDNASSNVLVEGRQSGLINSLVGSGFDHLGIRGYPLTAFYSRAATVGSLDLKFPVWRIFGGPGTLPLFFKNLYGFVFEEATYFPTRDQDQNILSSSGGGLNLGLDTFHYLPVQFRLEYDKGNMTEAGGRGELYFQIGVQAQLF